VLVEGSRIKGKVTGIERYGVFVQISGTSGRSGRGLVPSQETGTSRGSDLKKHFSVGQEIEAKILAVDESGKIRLSIAALGADDERGLFEAFKSGQTKPEEGAPAAEQGKKPAAKGKPEPRNFGTLGDLLPKIAPKPIAPKAAVKAPAAKPAAPRAKR
jgi:small subunit ribosomal protein S1